jgi:uncharacterized protein YdeI (YjbR/CyaY-like superfamily)
MQGFEGEMPQGLEMALARDPVALNYFMGLSYQEQKHFVQGAKAAQTAGEMRTYVAALTGNIQ